MMEKRINISFTDPDGIQSCEMPTGITKAFLIPRNKIKNITDGKYVDLLNSKAVIYFLFRKDGTKTHTYVGISEDINARLQQHNSKKYWWTDAICFLSGNGYLNSAHTRYLEKIAYEEIIRINNTTLTNSKTPEGSSLNHNEHDFALDFFEDIKKILEAFGYPIFKDINHQENTKINYEHLMQKHIEEQERMKQENLIKYKQEQERKEHIRLEREKDQKRIDWFKIKEIEEKRRNDLIKIAEISKQKELLKLEFAKEQERINKEKQINDEEKRKAVLNRIDYNRYRYFIIGGFIILAVIMFLLIPNYIGLFEQKNITNNQTSSILSYTGINNNNCSYTHKINTSEFIRVGYDKFGNRYVYPPYTINNFISGTDTIGGTPCNCITSFTVTNNIPSTIFVDFHYNIAQGDKLYKHNISLTLYDFESINVTDNHQLCYSTCYIIKNSVELSVIGGDFPWKMENVTKDICDTCVNKECLNDAEPCKTDNECGSKICNINGVCGTQKIVPCDDGKINKNNTCVYPLTCEKDMIVKNEKCEKTFKRIFKDNYFKIMFIVFVIIFIYSVYLIYNYKNQMGIKS